MQHDFVTSSTDILVLIFSFLDWRHIPKCALVSSDWNHAAGSNALWEQYFHQMSNNLKGKTKISTKELDQSEHFWRDMIRDNFSKYSVKLASHLIKGLTDLKLTISWGSVFPSPSIMPRFIKFLMGRIKIMSIYWSSIADANMKKVSQSHKSAPEIDVDYESYEIKYTVRVSGITDLIVVRFRMCPSFSLFGYGYASDYVAYCTTKENDAINEAMMPQNSPILLSKNLPLFKNTFVYVYGNSQIYGEDFMIQLLSQFVPTWNQCYLSPLNFIPIWFVIFGRIGNSFISDFNDYHYEIVKRYPTLNQNPLLLQLRYYNMISGRVNTERIALQNYLNEENEEIQDYVTKKKIPNYSNIGHLLPTLKRDMPRKYIGDLIQGRSIKRTPKERAKFELSLRRTIRELIQTPNTFAKYVISQKLKLTKEEAETISSIVTPTSPFWGN